MTRRGDWMQTASGRQLWPLDLRPEDIDLADIVHSLARQCRFNGHVRCDHYSVAQHSVLVSENVPSRLRLSALLHDAAETYLGDVIRPLKRSLYVNTGLEFQPFADVEERLMRAVRERFGLPLLTDGEQSIIGQADLLLLATEARDVMSPLHPDWPECEAQGWPVLTERIVPLGPVEAERLFLERFRELVRG